MPARWVAAHLVARIAELGLIVLGFGYTVLSDDAASDLSYLIKWDLLAVCYLATGYTVMRLRHRRQPGPGGSGGGLGLELLTGARLSFVFTFAASLVGMGSADSVISYGGQADNGEEIKIFGGPAIVLAWLLLHAGYARFYAWRYSRREASAGAGAVGTGLAAEGPSAGPGPGRGLEFPACAVPAGTDFLYFAFTVGTTFAVSDVKVTTQAMRWHVMTHAIFSFFYNTIVLAVAIGLLTGK
ncbi:MAG: DUF1345 domain-containing protein [Nocardiopsaceae bacterium]|nr:DUF1345 domain-containing protein [Nocardiopsaceae bacterium]